ncbi:MULTISPECIES: hypothetical protein [unclassified Chelatococcus]|uniref:hypothetical protein n=1 Tax=unclassified Chelatococcus TaxID=2638111 RepID=UPI001BCD1E6C|nr:MULTISPECIES: hypothetical protein [unclassified Chelatococcus]CAH1671723.1 conserved hypothetical protein [Hyphomicrobiales bacterium]MBS7738498.1 hypothetical protein [Chelatococcus sp. HY11]MBX3542902.1 hypothetical protein [Chelatococcus sp.]MCO5076972.1 hypothetical protein [Chelatococcus sp.]CAH1676067.1 conserved hypothetical protein [Hyphomicrobiales bacterium]
MPFSPPFKNFQAGDMLFGLGSILGAGLGRYTKYLAPGVCRQLLIVNCYLIRDETSFLGPAKHNKDFVLMLSQHPKYREALNPDLDYNTWSRKKSKFGLFWNAHNGLNTTAHFILDDLDLLDVIKKNNEGDSCPEMGIKGRSITGAELRWIYRNRYDPKVQRSVQFWLNGEPSYPPWEAGFDEGRVFARSEYWTLYRPRSQQRS